MDQHPFKQPLSVYGLLGAPIGAAIGVAVWYLFFRNWAGTEPFAGLFVGGIAAGALAGNSLGRAIRKK